MEVAGAREDGSETILKKISCFQVTDGAPILTFDPSVENFFSIMEAISELCGETKEESFEASEIEQFKSMIVFLREWKQFYFCEWTPFHYNSKTVSFTFQTESSDAKKAINGIKLPHLSSAAVPKEEKLPSTAPAFDNDDFVLHVGGSVWALDWCPRPYENIVCDVKCEYLAIAAHPTGSDYHKIGEQLSGRGFIQIWCFLHLGDKDELLNLGGVHCRGKGSMKVDEDPCVPKRRVRPRKTTSIQKEINGASNIVIIDSPSEPFSVRGIAISNQCCESSEFNKKEPKNSYSAGNLCDNNKVFEYSDNPIDGPRKSRGRPRKALDARIPRPRGRPRKHPITSSNGSAAVHGDQLLDSSSLSTSGDSPISVGCYIEDLQKGINSVSDMNEQGETLLCRGKGSMKVDEDPCVPKRRGRPRKTTSIQNEINGASNIDIIDSPSEPFSVRGIAISNQCCESSEFNKKEPKNSYSAGNLCDNKEVFEYSDNPIDAPRKSRGRPRKALDARIPRPRGRPRKHPITSSNGSAAIHGDQLLDSSSLSTSGDSPISVGCYVEDLQKGINSVSDMNEQGETLLCSGKPIQGVCSQFHVDDCDNPLVSLLPTGSNGKVGSFSSGLRRHTKSSIPSEHSIVPLSENLLALPISRVSKASKESDVTEKAIHANSQGVFNVGGCAMKSCLRNRKREVKNGAIIIYHDNDQAVSTKGLSPIREDHDLEDGVPCHVDDCRKIGAVTENSVQDQSFISEGISLPRLVLSLAHNGKIVWDMKWRPSNAVDLKAKHHLGYLAVLLGNGSLEVWDVPAHSLVKLLYSGCHTEDTDPRFLKLQPVFRCSMLKFGERQSIPLALEWSPSASRDLILAGCHDGTVALWKFRAQLSSKDTKPLLCFTADTAPIRCLAWAPDDSDVECSNLIVTAGHEGLKFWDLRSPYRPLLDLCPVQRAVLGVDWLKDPRCLVIAYEDGIMRTLSLTKIANDIPVTGEPSARTKQRGLHSQSCSLFAIWSVQVSRSTGLVAYCSSDGCARYFQLTTEAVEKDASRYRKPHFLCGSLAEEGQTLSINTPLKRVPLPLVSKVASNEARPIDSSMPALGWYKDHETNNNSSQKKRKGNPSKQAEAGEGPLQDIESRGDEWRTNIARFPPKIVAMHKVRWNMNKGSGRWLCYGGAAGIVRCQAISHR